MNTNKEISSAEKILLSNELTNVGLKIMANSFQFTADDVQAFITAACKLQEILKATNNL